MCGTANVKRLYLGEDGEVYSRTDAEQEAYEAQKTAELLATIGLQGDWEHDEEVVPEPERVLVSA